MKPIHIMQVILMIWAVGSIGYVDDMVTWLAGENLMFHCVQVTEYDIHWNAIR